jgi:hypothetical protein
MPMTPDDFAKAMSERNGAPASRPKPQIQPPNSRPLGLIVTAVGLMGLGYTYINFLDALHHAAEVEISPKFLLVGVPAFLIGMRWVIFGRKAPEAFGPPYKPTRGAVIYYIACFIASPVSVYAYLHYLSLLGYTATKTCFIPGC